ncbi:MAG: hypothetical protein GY820_38770 [Gammaproteobacteria bacterium]|nr:hypothetical protein [Gammaproteobacteria bacterium]
MKRFVVLFILVFTLPLFAQLRLDAVLRAKYAYPEITASGNVEIGGTLDVTGISTFTGNVRINGNLGLNWAPSASYALVTAGDMSCAALYATTVVAANLVATGAGNLKAADHVVPNADGTLDLGIETTAQWANVWADLVNGSDYAFLNDYRLLEAEKYKGYPSGIAIGNSHFTDGVVTDKMPRDARPLFVVTDTFIEYKGNRISGFKDGEMVAQKGFWDHPLILIGSSVIVTSVVLKSIEGVF